MRNDRFVNLYEAGEKQLLRIDKLHSAPHHECTFSPVTNVRPPADSRSRGSRRWQSPSGPPQGGVAKTVHPAQPHPPRRQEGGIAAGHSSEPSPLTRRISSQWISSHKDPGAEALVQKTDPTGVDEANSAGAAVLPEIGGLRTAATPINMLKVLPDGTPGAKTELLSSSVLPAPQPAEGSAPFNELEVLPNEE